MEFVERIRLHNCIRLIFSISIILFLSGLYYVSYASDSTGVSNELLIRSQLQSIADEVVDSARLDTKIRVAILVEGNEPRTLAENAFIEVLQKRNYTSVLKSGSVSEQTLHALILGVNIKIRELNTKLFERSISTILEVRTVTGAEQKVRMLGTFHREAIDTIQTFPSTQSPVITKEEDDGVMEKLLTPVIVIGGAILIVYLLFTVRS